MLSEPLPGGVTSVHHVLSVGYKNNHENCLHAVQQTDRSTRIVTFKLQLLQLIDNSFINVTSYIVDIKGYVWYYYNNDVDNILNYTQTEHVSLRKPPRTRPRARPQLGAQTSRTRRKTHIRIPPRHGIYI